MFTCVLLCNRQIQNISYLWYHAWGHQPFLSIFSNTISQSEASEEMETKIKGDKYIVIFSLSGCATGKTWETVLEGCLNSHVSIHIRDIVFFSQSSILRVESIFPQRIGTTTILVVDVFLLYVYFYVSISKALLNNKINPKTMRKTQF